MICEPCRNKRHEECPSNLAALGDKKPTGVNEENERIQRSGLCPCQHKVPVVEEDSDFHEAIHHANALMRATGITPLKCPYPECDETLVKVAE